MKEKLSFYSYSKIRFKLNISVKMTMNNHKIITFTDRKKKKGINAHFVTVKINSN